MAATGIDPRNDYVFQTLFGDTENDDVLISILNSALAWPPQHVIREVHHLKPAIKYSSLDEKLSILDVIARDQLGRGYNVEMQMALHAYFPNRFLYYWAKLHGQQLHRGQQYTELRPTISICFLNAILIEDSADYHFAFQVWDAKHQLSLTRDLDLHIFQLPNFHKSLDELSDPVDAWLYFLNNGSELDADDPPAPLDTPPFRKAMKVLKVFTQDEIQRQKYEDREKARRDADSWGIALAQRDDIIAQQIAELAKRDDELAHVRSATDKIRRQSAVEKIRMLERFLKQAPMPAADLEAMTIEGLVQLADRLEQESLED